MWAHKLTVQDYQDLIDRGWERCVCFSPNIVGSVKVIVNELLLQSG